MLVKLFASILAISDTGSIATSMIATDLPDSLCPIVAQEMFGKSTQTQLGGHTITFKANAYCYGLPGAVASSGPPQEFLDIFGGILSGVQNLNRNPPNVSRY